MPSRHSLISILLGLFLAAAVAFAQRDLGTVSGTVTDAQGAAIPNAKVAVINDATNVTTNSQSNDAGSFTVPALTPGTYTVTVEASGFQKSEQKGIVVNPGEPVDVNLGTAGWERKPDSRGDGGGAYAADGEPGSGRQSEFRSGEPVASRRPAHVHLPGAFVARRGPG